MMFQQTTHRIATDLAKVPFGNMVRLLSVFLFYFIPNCV